MKSKGSKHSESDHETQLKAFKVFRSYCRRKGCKYFGEHAVQGHCFHRLADYQSKYIDYVMAEGEGLLKSMREIHQRSKRPTDANWIKHLEGHVVTQWANGHFQMDELIHLRRENAALKFAKRK